MLLVGEQLTHSSQQVMKELQTVTQHVMNFGPSDPQPDGPGTPYRWSSLDDRVNNWMKKSDKPWGLIACGSPKWMNEGGAQYEILPQNYQAFADLIHAAVIRYSPGIEHVIVWNEMKGFWDHTLNRWNYEGYTKMYNLIYQAVKSVDPKIKVGGPYPELGAEGGTNKPGDLVGVWGRVDSRPLQVIDYFLKNAVGADFVTFDGHAAQKASGAIIGVDTAAKATTTFEYWKALCGYVKARSPLPVRVTELHVGQRSPANDLSPDESAAMYVAALDGLKAAGNAEVAYTWGNRSSSGIDSDGLLKGTATSYTLTPSGLAIKNWIARNSTPVDPRDQQILDLQAKLAACQQSNTDKAATITLLQDKIDAGRAALA